MNRFLLNNFINNKPDSDDVVPAMNECYKKFPFTQIIIGIESTSVYSIHRALLLAANTILKLLIQKYIS